MKKLKALIMSFLLLLSISMFWSCQQGQEEVGPDATADVMVDPGVDDDDSDDDDDDGDDDD